MKIGFIGCGNMGSAMISGMLKKGLYKKDEIIVSNLTEEEQKIIFSDSQRISRQHLKIFWDFDTHEWKIQSLSKNKIFVNKMLIRREDPPVHLDDCAAIKFDKYMFYFFPAV